MHNHCQILIDCIWSKWELWSDCMISGKSCGIVKRIRTRQKAANEKNGGNCPGQSMEQEDCKNNPCPETCKWSQWTGWNVCSKTCGVGERVRTRKKTIIEKDGYNCVGSYEEISDCNILSCPEVRFPTITTIQNILCPTCLTQCPDWPNCTNGTV